MAAPQDTFVNVETTQGVLSVKTTNAAGTAKRTKTFAKIPMMVRGEGQTTANLQALGRDYAALVDTSEVAAETNAKTPLQIS